MLRRNIARDCLTNFGEDRVIKWNTTYPSEKAAKDRVSDAPSRGLAHTGGVLGGGRCIGLFQLAF